MEATKLVYTKNFVGTPIGTLQGTTGVIHIELNDAQQKVTACYHCSIL
jgi:hypothetical protein